MIDCTTMQERMPEVAHGIALWTPAESAHLASCDDCASEWRLVHAGFTVGQDVVVDAERITSQLLQRLRSEPAPSTAIRRLPWRGGIIGVLVAAAASVLVIVYAPQHERGEKAVVEGAVVETVLPELQSLSDAQLDVVLKSLGPAASDATPGLVPHLEDLTDSELEQLLQPKGEE